MAAGTIYCIFAAPPSPCALPTAIWCRTDTSWESPSTPLLPSSQLGLIATPASTRPLPTIASKVTGADYIPVPSPFPRLPVGDKRAVASLTVSAPNRWKRDNCCSVQSPHGAFRNPKPVAGFARHRSPDGPDVSRWSVIMRSECPKTLAIDRLAPMTPGNPATNCSLRRGDRRSPRVAQSCIEGLIWQEHALSESVHRELVQPTPKSASLRI